MVLRRGAKALIRRGLTILAESCGKSDNRSKSISSSEVPARGILERDLKASSTGLTDEQTGSCRFGLHKTSLQVILVGLLLTIVALSTSVVKEFSGSDTPQCHSVYMYPSYAKIDGFDHRYTKLAQKYHLYLYREQGKDREPLENDALQLDGIPVLFIPGNAGSFKQARSIAAACANVYFDERSSIDNDDTKNLDFFTADFNEDFTAFHGRTMLDQAEYLNDAIAYILSLYRSSQNYEAPVPSSVIVVGHSMGGIVARVMPTLKNYIPESVNSYITLSAPHALAPVTFDGDMLKIYERISKFWKAQFEDSESFFSKNVSLISITGGVLDNILPADFTTIEDIIPYTNGFTTYTTTVPHVWTPIDHLAIVWCDQLRNVLARVLLESVNAKKASKTKLLEERMRLYRKALLSGLEGYSVLGNSLYRTEPNAGNSFELQTGYEKVRMNEKFVLTKETAKSRSRFSVISIEKDRNDSNFALLTDEPSLNIRFCQKNSSSKLEEQIEESSISEWWTQCTRVDQELLNVPKSSRNSNYPSDSSWGGNSSPFFFLLVDTPTLSQYDLIVIETPNSVLNGDTFVVAELSDEALNTAVHDNPFGVITTGLLKAERSVNSKHLVSSFTFTNLYSSIISYRVRTVVSGESNTFEPFFRQSIEKPFETKWHINLRQGPQDINFHNVAPFVPLNSTHDKSLKLTFINPPGVETKIKVEVNWSLTVKMLLLRFRLSIAAFTIGFVSLTMAYQFKNYQSTGDFVPFDNSIDRLLTNHWKAMFISTSLLIPFTNLLGLQKNVDDAHLLRQFLSPLGYSSSTSALFLGTDEMFMWWLGPVFLLMTISSVFLTYRLIATLEAFTYWAVAKGGRYFIWSSEKSESRFSRTKQAIGALIIVTSVIFYVPYQFAFIILTIVQAFLCLKLSTLRSRHTSNNVKNFNNSILMLMIFLVPINVPIVMVFMRNFAIRWETPFQSHHNVLAILPIILLIESNARFRMPAVSPTKSLVGVAIMGCLVHMSAYSFILGTRNLYWLHHLFNTLSAVLFLRTFD
ncbi:LADA_0A06150g1_1 [Lachancea dasiensis]|uniref:GPI inositol-deacylase n=1 Tax=Lachancea dasiensis TaxID=1072105 RepID=A0A1G4IPG3_9SACH|nr:LADA_0A06150g1_1 [Lachancea dasiensis]